MIVVCEKCLTKYAVPDDKIGPTGRNVKCAKCSFVWLQSPLKVEKQIKADLTEDSPTSPPEQPSSQKELPITEAKAEQPKKTSLPVVVKSSSNIWLSFAASLLIVFNLSLLTLVYSDYITIKYPISEHLYTNLDIYNIKNFALNDFKLIKTEGENNYTIQGKISNIDARDHILPNVELIVLDDEGKQMASHIIDHHGNYLLAGSNLEFQNPITHLPAKAQKIVVKLESKY